MAPASGTTSRKAILISVCVFLAAAAAALLYHYARQSRVVKFAGDFTTGFVPISPTEEVRVGFIVDHTTHELKLSTITVRHQGSTDIVKVLLAPLHIKQLEPAGTGYVLYLDVYPLRNRNSRIGVDESSIRKKIPLRFTSKAPGGLTVDMQSVRDDPETDFVEQ